MPLLGKIIGFAVGKALEAYSKAGKPDYVGHSNIYTYSGDELGGLAIIRLKKTKTAALVLVGKQYTEDPVMISNSLSNGIIYGIFAGLLSGNDPLWPNKINRVSAVKDKSAPVLSNDDAFVFGSVIGYYMYSKSNKKEIWNVLKRYPKAKYASGGFTSWGDVVEGYPTKSVEPRMFKGWPFWIKLTSSGLLGTKEKIHYLLQMENTIGPARYWDRIVKVDVNQDLINLYNQYRTEANAARKKEIRKALISSLNGYLKKLFETGKYTEVGYPQGPFVVKPQA